MFSQPNLGHSLNIVNTPELKTAYTLSKIKTEATNHRTPLRNSCEDVFSMRHRAKLSLEGQRMQHAFQTCFLTKFLRKISNNIFMTHKLQSMCVTDKVF